MFVFSVRVCVRAYSAYVCVCVFYAPFAASLVLKSNLIRVATDQLKLWHFMKL